jgi:uncharacterized membrane protein SirB2
LILILCAVLSWYALNIDYTPRPGTIGPSFWPMVAISIVAIAATLELGARLLGRTGEGSVAALGEEFEQEAEAEMAAIEPPASNPLLLMAGVALLMVYAFALPTLGFVVATFALIVLFMYLGGVRSHLTIWGSALIGMLAVAFIFWKIAYISVPRGTPPFDQVTQWLQTLMHVR